jgi:class 3 adenylate cyclase
VTAEALDLTRRERDVLAALCRPVLEDDVFTEPASVRQIAAELVVTEAAVEQHLLNLYDKFRIPREGARRRVALAREALRRDAVGLAIPKADGHNGSESTRARESGLRAVAERRWREAADLLGTHAASGGAGADDLDALADAAHAVGDYDAALRMRETAHAAYLAEGDHGAAAAVAIKLSSIFVRRGDFAVAGGWVQTAERVLVDQPESVGRGLTAWMKGMFAAVVRRDLEDADLLANEALDIADRQQHADLHALALMLRSEVRAKQGRAGEAMPLLDEAMTQAVGTRLTPWASCHILCRAMIVCQQTGDLARAKQWTAAARAACEREGTVPFSGDCRVHHACLLNEQGAWPEAEQEAQTGCEELPADLLHLGIASYELGEIHLRRGDLDRAEEALDRASELGQSPYPALALLRLAQGDAPAASAMIATAVDDETFPFRRALLLATQVEIALARGELETAQHAVAELDSLEHSLAGATVEAFANVARGALALASGDPATASTLLRKGANGWTGIGAPYRAARARMQLSDAYLGRDDPASAEVELRAARTTFEKLGARPEAQQASKALRSLRPDAAGGSQSRRVTRAFVFTDIVGSTALVEALGDDAWADLRRWHDRALRAEFAAHSGQEVDHAGDGFFVAFASAAGALRCAQAIQRKLQEHRRNQGFAPQVRIGIHADDVGATNDGYIGSGVHTAARIGAEAQGGEILVSRKAAEASGDDLDLGKPRTVTLKGLTEPVELLPLAWS